MIRYLSDFPLTLAIAFAVSMAIVCGIAGAGEPAAKQRTQAVIYTMDGCAPCVAMKRDVLATLEPAGWRIADDAYSTTDPKIHIIFTDKPARGVRSFPTTIIYRDGREVSRQSGQITARQLAADVLRINALCDCGPNCSCRPVGKPYRACKCKDCKCAKVSK